MAYSTSGAIAILMVGTTFDTATTALCNKLITRADNEINKYLSKRYEIENFNNTTASIPPLVTSLSEQITEAYMYISMARGARDEQKRGLEMLALPIENLKRIAEFESDLLDSSGNPIAESSNSAYRILCNTETYSPTFNEDDPLDWKTDALKLDDIDADRERNG